MNKEIEISTAFKKKVQNTIGAIVLFVVVYFLLCSLAIGLAIACITGGIMLITIFPSYVTIILGAGIIITSIIILVFLIKFIFKSTKAEEEAKIEITAHNEPELYTFIQHLSGELQVPVTGKIFLVPDVNAAVVNRAGMAGLFFTSKKNLHIGLGLMKCTTTDELKVIIAHELGHFAQRSMRIGSYVYQVNRVIYNILFENDGIEKTIYNIQSISNALAIFMLIAVKIMNGMQWVLGKIFELINVQYMGLSRQMEFNADAVAANLVGYNSLKTALYRTDFSQYAFQTVIDFYNDKIPDNIRPDNLYEKYFFVMNFLAEKNRIPFEYGLPDVTKHKVSKYGAPKLQLNNQWQSHPSNEDRIQALEKNFSPGVNEGVPATHLLKNITETEKLMTQRVFEKVTYEKSPVIEYFNDFKAQYTEAYKKKEYDEIYNGLYDSMDPYFEDTIPVNSTENDYNLFADEHVEKVSEYLHLINDLAVVQEIANKKTNLKTFEYDGYKYKTNEAGSLLKQLKGHEKKLEEYISGIHYGIQKKIEGYFEHCGKKDEWEINKKGWMNNIQQKKSQDELAQNINNALQTLQTLRDADSVKKFFSGFYSWEKLLQDELKQLMETPLLIPEIKEYEKEKIEKFIKNTQLYIHGNIYNQETLNNLFYCFQLYLHYYQLLHIYRKKNILSYILPAFK